MNKIWHRLIKKSFPFWERLGLHVTPNHFYEPVPDTRTLPADLWERKSKLKGIDLNPQGQRALLSQFTIQFEKEYESFPRNKTKIPYEFYLNNFSFGSVDAEVLYCMIRHFRPRSVIEIGAGHSTTLSLQAILKNKKEIKGYECELTAIEPYLNETLRLGLPGLFKLIPKKVEEVPLSFFESLEAGDILFVDSSHTLKIGGDVQYIFLEILPRLQKGVLIHFHDIFLPAEYHKRWILNDHLFWNEQYLLQAFLAFNDCFEVLWAGSYLHLNAPDLLKAAFDSYEREQNWPGSFWIRRIK